MKYLYKGRFEMKTTTKILTAVITACLSVCTVSANTADNIGDLKKFLLGENSNFTSTTETNVSDLLKLKNSVLSPQYNKVYVADTEELRNALKNAKAGDEIILTGTDYGDDVTGSKGSSFTSSVDGTAEKNIVIKGADPENPPTLHGKDIAHGIVLYITGDYWQIKNIRVENAQKGILLDNSNYSVIENCEIFNTGQEAVHFRDNSSYCTIRNSVIHDTGKVTAGYGEGVYIGTYYEDTSKYKENGYGENCHYNTVSGCKFYNVTAEHVDIKEQTIGTIVENCYMDGTGMTGANYADSFIDVQGNDAEIRNNECHRNNNSYITDAFQVHVLIDGWGKNNSFYGNTVYLDDETSCYVIESWGDTALYGENIRIPQSENMMYDGYFELISNN